MKNWGFWADDVCLCCSMAGETAQHALHCTDVRMTTTYREEATSLLMWSDSTHCHPALLDFLWEAHSHHSNGFILLPSCHSLATSCQRSGNHWMGQSPHRPPGYLLGPSPGGSPCCISLQTVHPNMDGQPQRVLAQLYP